MTEALPNVEQINVSQHYVVFEGGAIVPIDCYLDLEECCVEDPEDAFYCRCEHPVHGWLDVQLTQEPITLH
ncbi:hypothetical protein MRS76_07720 [Rhizobiaceae bacterium n13]|uniref:Uncharacterized protein n=1 Tax=Ferirhizobium litorale TaxID=2927786 RepID=A0AAE3QE02_9HYPH|nr:hypothetical protein [Fererhizobium litorale]MDI7861843.1 hypothetical protein [Fererhizobium litorale]MDI7921815.1 hypothetical protein [Fererhizobium litorale]